MSTGWKDVPCILGRSRQSRAIWTQTYGSPGPLWVLHRCHQKTCQELQHMYLGTALDNERDARKRWGEDYRWWTRPWKLKEDDVQHVKEFIASECYQDQKSMVLAKDLRRLYHQWSEPLGYGPINMVTFGQILGALGYVRYVSNSHRWWLGLAPL